MCDWHSINLSIIAKGKQWLKTRYNFIQWYISKSNESFLSKGKSMSKQYE